MTRKKKVYNTVRSWNRTSCLTTIKAHTTTHKRRSWPHLSQSATHHCSPLTSDKILRPSLARSQWLLTNFSCGSQLFLQRTSGVALWLFRIVIAASNSVGGATRRPLDRRLSRSDRRTTILPGEECFFRWCCIHVLQSSLISGDGDAETSQHLILLSIQWNSLSTAF